MNLFSIRIGALLGAIGVAIGAFGAHAFKPFLLASGKLETFETAVKYHFYGVFALILVGILAEKFPNKFIKWSSTLFLIGTLIFSGSLYLICASGINLFGAIAPIGGTCLVAAWILLFMGVKKS